MKRTRKIFMVILFLAVYLISAVPIGLFLYSIKSNADLNIFTKTGFHAYKTCLQEQAALATGKKDGKRNYERER